VYTYNGGSLVFQLNNTGAISVGTWNGSTIGVAYGGTGVTSSSGANSVVLRDTNANIVWNNEAPGYSAITSAGTVTTLTSASAYYQNIQGTQTQTIKLPAENTVGTGTAYVIDNDSTQNVTVTDSAGNTLASVTPGMAGYIYSTSNSAATGGWAGYAYVPGSGPTGAITWGTAGLNLGGGTLTGSTGTFTSGISGGTF